MDKTSEKKQNPITGHGIGDNMDLLCYLRKSRAEEGMDTDEVLARHWETLRELADKRGDHIIEVYKEVVSGESLYARPEMMRLLSDVSDNKADGVLCMDLDRLSRGRMTDQGMILDAMKWSNTKIVTPDKVYDLNEEMDEQSAEFKTFISRQEYKQIVKRLRRGVLRSVQDGCYVSNAPYGYKKTTIDRKPTLEIVSEEAGIVKTMFDMYENGLGCQSIATWANDVGAKPRRSERFTRTSVKCILQNPTYCGNVIWNRLSHVRKGQRGNEKHLTIYNPKEKWILVDGLHKAIVSKDQFDKVQAIFKDRYIPSKNDGEIKSPLVGLIKCGNCGKNMQRIPYSKKGGNNKDYLYCMTKGCIKASPYEYVEEMVIAHLRDTMKALEKRKTADNKDAMLIQEKLLDATRQKVIDLRSAKQRLYDFLEDGTYSVETFRERMAVANDKIDAATRKADEIELKIEHMGKEDKHKKAEKIKTVLDAYMVAGPSEKNRLLRTVIKEIIYSKSKDDGPRGFDLDVKLK